MYVLILAVSTHSAYVMYTRNYECSEVSYVILKFECNLSCNLNFHNWVSNTGETQLPSQEAGAEGEKALGARARWEDASWYWACSCNYTNLPERVLAVCFRGHWIFLQNDMSFVIRVSEILDAGVIVQQPVIYLSQPVADRPSNSVLSSRSINFARQSVMLINWLCGAQMMTLSSGGTRFNFQLT